MDCPATRTAFRALADGEPVSPEVGRHLKTCVGCRAEKARYDALVTALHRMPRLEPTPRQSRAIHHNVQAGWQAGQQRRKRTWTLGLATASLGALIFGSLLMEFPQDADVGSHTHPGEWVASDNPGEAGKSLGDAAAQITVSKPAAPEPVTTARRNGDAAASSEPPAGRKNQRSKRTRVLYP